MGPWSFYILLNRPSIISTGLENLIQYWLQLNRSLDDRSSTSLTLYHHLELFCHPNFAIADSCKFDRPLLTPQIEVAIADKGDYVLERRISCKLQNSILIISDKVDANPQYPKGITFRFSMITFAPE